ncbi:hypothetical protein [Parasitella parasitica]|uniref:Endonuclease/exonuclease/phosphatase domain-containing protein n=1 Tax=Parasitella parasitica TaxID=35722 RepID=A0A0B7NRD8_9FUNG|nr:hypothetical protein [Parasitella parasitica]
MSLHSPSGCVRISTVILKAFRRSLGVTTCIDYIFGHASLSPRLANSQLLYMPSRWTDHCLLTVDLLPATASIGPDSWRFNPTFLADEEFPWLLNATVSLFFSDAAGVRSGGSRTKGIHTSQDGSGDPEGTVTRWESFKLLLKCCAQKYTRGMKARFKNKGRPEDCAGARQTDLSLRWTTGSIDKMGRISPQKYS